MGKEARNFSTGKSYVVGDLCMYGGVLYQFTAAHSAGAWNPAHVKNVDDITEGKITEIIAVYDRGGELLQFANAVAFEASNITDTRYKYIFTNETN